MTTTYTLREDFENLIRKLFLAEGYTFLQASAGSRDEGYDFILLSPSKEKVVVEVKVFRTRVVARGNIIRAVTALESVRQRIGADRGVFVISGRLGIGIVDTGKTEVLDLNKLVEMISRHSHLAADFESTSRALLPMPASMDVDSLAYTIFGDVYFGVPEAEPTPPRGKQLEKTLRAVPAGKEGEREFERNGYEALRYIFDKDFTNWSEQKITDGGMSRYDVIARIASDHDFWKSIVDYFRSWYVVFEFKNYTDSISQGQIYTTEKYLFTGAMRSVAFIISRTGADKNALAATRGAVRESGKLIVILSIDDICRMLEMKDSGDDPNAVLFDLLDDMLMKLER